MGQLLNALRENLAQAEQLGNDEWAKRLKKRIAAEEKASETVADLGDQKVDVILSEVGDDPTLAAAALEAESAKENPRKTLVAGLESVIAAAQPEDGE